MLKLLTFPGIDDDGNVFVRAINPSAGLTKMAEAGIDPKISSFIGSIKPCKSRLYVLVNALGAGEYYGSNINGDYFEESELNPTDPSVVGGYKTFSRAGIYRHHKNKDINRSMGKVVCATYNPIMHRVELVVEVDRERAQAEGHGDLVDKLDEGGNPAVSMGCKVAHDICSICGHKSKTRADYCIHAKNMMGKVLPDGRKVFVYNPRPKFFDLSFVVIGADRTSYAMAKVASAQAVSSALAAEMEGIRDGYSSSILKEKLARKRKISNILKRVPVMSAEVMPDVDASEPDIPRGILDSMAEEPLEKALTTSSSMGIVLKPREFQRIVLIRIGKKPLADDMDRRGMLFPPSDDVDRSVTIGRRGDHSPDIRDMLMGMVPNRSMFGPVITRRIIVIKKSNKPIIKEAQSLQNPVLQKVAAGYNGYREQLLEKMGQVVANITSSDIKLLSAVSGSRLEDEFLGGSFNKTAGLPLALLGALPLAYLYGAHARKRRSTGESLGPLDRFIEKHPMLATSVFVGLTRLGMGLKSSGQLGKALHGMMGKFS